MEPGSLINRGFPEGTVEMREARQRALTHFLSTSFFIFKSCRMREARQRALTQDKDNLCVFSSTVEMREDRQRALAHAILENKFGDCALIHKALYILQTKNSKRHSFLRSDRQSAGELPEIQYDNAEPLQVQLFG